MEELIGKNVVIEWTDDADWHHFVLLALNSGMAKIKGRDDPDGITHRGDAFWVKRDLIKTIQEDA